MLSPKLKNKPKPKTLAASERVLRFEAIGTQWRITLQAELTKSKLTETRKRIMDRIEQFDSNYSRFRASSLITRMSQRSGVYDLPPDAKPLFDLYKELYDLTDGLMTPLIGQLLSDAGYDAEYSLKAKESLPQTPSWDEALEYNFPTLTIKHPVLLDLGAAGKGYLVDILADLFTKAGMSDFCIDAGGDILQHQKGTNAVRVGLEHPDYPEQVIGVAMIANQSICGSAGNRRAWKSFHHIMNPNSKSSTDHIRAVWVITDSTLLADGLSTALFFVDPSVLRKRYTFEYAIIRSDYSLDHSTNFPAEFFTDKDSDS